MEQSLGLGKPHSQYVVSDMLGIETLNSSSKCKLRLLNLIRLKMARHACIGTKHVKN